MFERREFHVSWLRVLYVWCREVDRVGRWREVFEIKRRLERELIELWFRRNRPVGEYVAVLGVLDYERCVELGVQVGGVDGVELERGEGVRGVGWHVVGPVVSVQPVYASSYIRGVTGMQGTTGVQGVTGVAGWLGEPGVNRNMDAYGVGPVEVQVSFDYSRRLEELQPPGPRINRRMGWLVNERVEPQPVQERERGRETVAPVKCSVCGCVLGSCAHTRGPSDVSSIVLFGDRHRELDRQDVPLVSPDRVAARARERLLRAQFDFDDIIDKDYAGNSDNERTGSNEPMGYSDDTREQGA